MLSTSAPLYVLASAVAVASSTAQTVPRNNLVRLCEEAVARTKVWDDIQTPFLLIRASRVTTTRDKIMIGGTGWRDCPKRQAQPEESPALPDELDEDE